jgi:N-dimethylarginine dimethylaminohydrolase
VTQHILMCVPRHYRIEYEINPWMHRANAVDPERALAQWTGLHGELTRLGLEIELVNPEPGLPDMTFTANAGIVRGSTFISSNFRFSERQLEAAHFSRWFESHGYSVTRIHEPHFWEGEGDVLNSGDRVFAGYRFRTEFAALDHLDDLLETKPVRLELVDPRFYHLDTCFCPLSDRRALFYPPAFSPAAQSQLATHFPDLIAVADDDALRFACNAFVAGDTVVLNSGCPGTVSALTALGYRCVETPMDEFIKAGGSVKCLILTLDGLTRGGRAAGTSPG